MTEIINSPQDTSVFEVEARKSFSFGMWFVDARKEPVDLTGASVTMTVAKFDRYGIATVLISKDAALVDPAVGYCTINVQAVELDVKPMTYQFTTTLRVNGYSVVVMKGDFTVRQNAEYASVGSTFVTANPSQNLEVMLRSQTNVHLELSTVLPPGLVTPTDASDQAVAGYVNNPLSLTRAVLDDIYATVTYVDTQIPAYFTAHLAADAEVDAAKAVNAGDPTDLAIANRVMRRSASGQSHVANPTLPTHAANKTYVDTQIPAVAIPKAAFTAKGQLITSTASATNSTLAAGAAGQVLTADPSLGPGMKWDDPTISGRAIGLLEADYRGGPARVKINGALSSTAYNWLTPYQPGSSRQVRLERFGSEWLIAGQTEEDYAVLSLASNWITYSEVAVTTTFSNTPRAVKLPSGIVILTGLLYANVAPADGAVIFTLPAGLRPDADILHHVEMADIARIVNIKANGDVVVYGAGWPANYLSLDGIAFPAAGVATWTPFGSGGSTWGANFQNSASWDAQWGYPSFWKDPYGFVWYRGLVQVKTATSADDTRIVNMPTGYTGDQPQHIRIAANGSFGNVQFNPSGLNWKTGTPGAAGNWLSLGGVMGITTEAGLNNPWRIFHRYANAWFNYGTVSFPAGQWLLREDGLRVLRGLLSGSALGTRAAILPTAELWPRNGRLIMATVATSARGRMDISGVDDRSQPTSPYEVGSLNTLQGTPTWYSLDSLRWIC